MFKISIGSEKYPIQFYLRGCPDFGVEAVDFRRAAGIQPEPNAHIIWRCEHVSETLARTLPLDTGADWSFHSYERRAVVTPSVLRAAMSTPNDITLAELIVELRQQAPWQIEEASRLELAKNREEEKEAVQNAERAARDKAAAAARADAERKELEALRAFFTAPEQFLAARGKLDAEAVGHRLELAAERDIETKLSQMPLPAGYNSFTMDTGDEAEVPHAASSSWLDHWDSEWVPTIQAIEAVTGHPVFGAVRGCIHIYSHATVPWTKDLMPVRITLQNS